MMVPGMTLEEIKKEVAKDFAILYRKMGYVTEEMHKKWRREKKPDGYAEFFNYTSKYKNHWIYRLQSFKKYCAASAMLLYYNGKGHAAISVSKDISIIYHTGHFFLRYNERRNLQLKTLEDIVRAYMNENFDIEYLDLEKISDKVTHIFGEIDSGVVLGSFHRRLDFLRLNTYLPHHMLSRNQNQRLAELKATMNESDFDADSLI